MVDLDLIRSEMQAQMEKDREIRVLTIYASSLEDALSDAAIQFNTSIANLEYEVLEHGSPGILSLGRRPWLIRTEKLSDVQRKKLEEEEKAAGTEAVQEEIKIQDKDGVFFIRLFNSDIMLKVIPPAGNGETVQLNDVLESLKQIHSISLNRQAINDCVKKGTDAQYVPVGIYNHVAGEDAKFTIAISSDEMEAMIIVTRPGKNGSDVAPDRIRAACRVQGVVDNVDWSPLEEFLDDPVYDIPTVVARGINAVDGKDASIQYLFETDTTKLLAKETEGGRIDFKQLNIVQNVVQGQTVAQKTPAERGENGRTLLGKVLMAKNGVDIPLPLGTHVRADGFSLVAEINGRVFLQNGRVHVEPILELDNVSIKTGNIEFLGTVIVKGSVDDGFSVKASGDITVSGTVGKAKLEADGDIMIQNGIMGQNQGTDAIRAGKSLWAKFIQNAIVEAGEDVIVGDGIISSLITANRRIILNGKRATIIGGHLYATEEINAKTIGAADAGAETILEVGFDVTRKRRLNALLANQARLIKDLNALELNIQTFENLKKSQKVLAAEKQLIYNELLQKSSTITAELKSISVESKEISAFLNNSTVDGKVSASAIVYPGVKLVIRDAKTDIKTEVRAVTFRCKNGVIERGKYVDVSSLPERQNSVKRT
ncbi:MAG: FapA family protein [Treponema sp.]|jgi:uncharacterized protein (DUF342 family)|nr:FapA family protein [Treponema sp.]